MPSPIEQAVLHTVYSQELKNLPPEEHFIALLESMFHTIKEAYTGQKIALVCGVVSANGDENIDENIARLITWRHTIKNALQQNGSNLPILTSPFLFAELLYEKGGAYELTRQERETLLQKFYQIFLQSNVVSHIFVTPGFEDSPGTLDEIMTARTEGATVVYITEQQPLGDYAG